MQRFRVVHSGISHELLLVFPGLHNGLKARVFTKKIQVTSEIFHGYTTRKGCTTMLYHAIENTVARWEGSVECRRIYDRFPAFWIAEFSSNISKTSASVSSGFQTRENWWKHEAAGRVLLLFSSVWNPDETRSTSFWNYFSNKTKLV